MFARASGKVAGVRAEVMKDLNCFVCELPPPWTSSGACSRIPDSIQQLPNA